MKRCPSCNETFAEEWLSFCTKDGTTLIEDAGSASEPPPTIMAPPPAVPKPELLNLNLPAAEYGMPVRQFGERSIQPEWKPPPPPSYAQPQTNGLALASMIVGIASVLCFGPLPAIVAIILGLSALSQIKKNPDRAGGQNQAWTGIITGGVALVIHGAILILYVALIGLSVANH
jgi:hypothetical protein